jgi:hypothetical protein
MRSNLTAGLIAALALGGCSLESSGANSGGPSTSTSTTSSSSGGGTGGEGGSSGEGGNGPECEGPGYKSEVTPQVFNSAEATIIDVQGAPIPDLQIQVCSLDLCLVGNTDASGHVVVAGAGQMMRKPAFKYGDGLDYVRLAALVPPEASVVYETPFTAARYPDLSDGQAITAGQPVTSNGITVTIPAGASIEIDTLVFDTPEKQKLRAVEVPLDAAGPALDPAIPLEQVFAIAPLDTLVCPAAAVSVPNTLGWPAGSDVEFFVHGLEVREEWAPYGGWAKASDGKVSQDGTRIETAPDGGLPLLGVFGVHRK